MAYDPIVLTVYDLITAKLAAVLPDHWRLPNPYDPASNSWLKLNKGYGVAIGPAFDTNRSLSCIISWKRTFTILISEKVTVLENDLDRRIVIEKDILTSHDILLKAFYKDLSLSTSATIASVTSDGGVRFLDGDREKFLAMEINLDVEYQDKPSNTPPVS